MKVQLTCQCGKLYLVRQADLNRGWGKSCSKRCAAIKRMKEGRNSHWDSSRAQSDPIDKSAADDQSWDAHKIECGSISNDD